MMSNTSYDESGTCDRPMDIAMQQAVDMVIYNSHTERIISLLVVILVSILTILGQMSVVVTTVLTNTLRETPHFFVLVCLCVVDLFMILTTTSTYIWQFTMGCIPITVCRITSAITETTGCGLAGHTAYIAFERCVFFCYPLRYEHMFSTCKIILTLCSIYGFSLVSTASVDIFITRTYHAAGMVCTLPEKHRLWGVLRQLSIFLPCTVMILYSVIKIGRLMKTCSVVPAAVSTLPVYLVPLVFLAPLVKLLLLPSQFNKQRSHSV